MSQYEAIDPALSAWAIRNSVRWYSEYQDCDVRTFYLNPEEKDRVQVAVDAPQDGKTTVRVGQLQSGLSRLTRRRDFPTPIQELSLALDQALVTAKEWLAEGRHST